MSNRSIDFLAEIIEQVWDAYLSDQISLDKCKELSWSIGVERMTTGDAKITIGERIRLIKKVMESHYVAAVAKIVASLLKKIIKVEESVLKQKEMVSTQLFPLLIEVIVSLIHGSPLEESGNFGGAFIATQNSS